MRIGQLTDCYLPVLNGVTNMVRTHKAELERLGHSAPVFTAGHLEFDDGKPDVIRSWGVPLGGSGYVVAPGYSQRAQVALAGLDVLHAHHPFVAGQLALRYGRRFGQPVVYTNHTRLDLYAGVYAPRVLAGLARWMLRRYIPRFVSRCDLVIAPSEGLATVMRERWGVTSPVAVVPNGIELARFRRPPARAGRADLGLPPDGPLAIYTGRLGEEKSLDLLLRAFVRVASCVAEAHLLLLGDGPQAAALRALAGELGLEGRVTFAGGVPYERVPVFLSVADVFASASISEVHPLSLIEGLAAGLPVVGVVSPGVADSVEDGVNGLLTPHDLTAYAGALKRLMTDRELRARLAEGARQSSARFGIEHTTAKTVAHYQRLIEDGARVGQRATDGDTA